MCIRDSFYADSKHISTQVSTKSLGVFLLRFLHWFLRRFQPDLYTDSKYIPTKISSLNTTQILPGILHWLLHILLQRFKQILVGLLCRFLHSLGSQVLTLPLPNWTEKGWWFPILLHQLIRNCNAVNQNNVWPIFHLLIFFFAVVNYGGNRSKMLKNY